MNRRAFTLIEMLVATIVFLVGFVAVFGLFLGGVRFRKLAEDTTRSSLAASCLVDEIRCAAGGGNTTSPLAPSAYLYSGFANIAAPAGGAAPGLQLYPYAPIPNTWYQVLTCTDLNGGDSPTTTVLHLQLFVVPFATTATELTLEDLRRRLLSQDLPSGSPPSAIISELVNRGLGFRFQAVITRRPSWLPD